ncbi:MAG: hypothetical protein NTX50_22795 [Candidatus Sumerlaeota bacterium]|nr:hypothetical protein [Candidatus Sumerlaeota bacterium]
MPAIKPPKIPGYISQLCHSVQSQLKECKIPAQVKAQKVPSTNLFRLYVMAPKLKKLMYSERQDLIWRMVDKALPKDKQMRISMIRATSPNEFAEK